MERIKMGDLALSRKADAWYAGQSEPSLTTVPPPTPDKLPSGSNPTTDCACGSGLGWYLLDVPYGHPDWGVLQRCACGAARQARSGLTVAQLSTDLGALADTTFAAFDLARPLPPASWEGQTLSED